MKVLFAHDHNFFMKNDSIYSKVDFGMAMWNRYMEVFDSLVIAARISEVTSDMDFSKMNRTKLDESISIVQLNSISGLRNFLNNRNTEYKKLKKSISEIDYVIARIPSEIGLMAIDIARKNNVPYVVELVGSPFDAYWYHGAFAAKIYAPLISHRVKKAVKNSSHVIYVTENYLQSKYPTERKSINCSNININIDYNYEELVNKIERYKDFQYVKDIKIGLNGSLTSNYKGIDTAIDALSKLDNKYSLHILGAGPKRKWVEYARKRDVENRVFFEGSLPSGDPVLKWLDNIDIYIQPSQTEGLPRALIEAMSRGCLCIGSNRGGIPELLPTHKMHNPNDFITLKKMILDITRNTKDMLEISRRNYNKSRKYGYEIINKRRKDFLKDFKKSQSNL